MSNYHPLSLDPEALASIGSYIQREWGTTGYRVTLLANGPRGSAVAEVTANDGSKFHVAATRNGNTVHASTMGLALSRIQEQVLTEDLA